MDEKDLQEAKQIVGQFSEQKILDALFKCIDRCSPENKAVFEEAVIILVGDIPGDATPPKIR
ncbi:MAG: hypothetical protein GY841_10270 [FCB group bacterium]|nr:hypothetical protein [FCB group bacterium]